jgi:hypothetical protein
MEAKRVKLELVGLDGNAFVLLGAFSGQARREGWTQEEINAVLTDVKSSNYDHLLQVLIAHCDSPDDADYEYEDSYAIDEE